MSIRTVGYLLNDVMWLRHRVIELSVDIVSLPLFLNASGCIFQFYTLILGKIVIT